MFFSEFNILKKIENNLLNEIKKLQKRQIFDQIPRYEGNGIILRGERGVGKTTLLLQKRQNTPNSFYFSADNVIISEIGLFKFINFLIEEFEIKYFFIDEIFKYKNWTIEIKNIIDSFPTIKLYCSGSSALKLYEGIVDLGRRIFDIHIKGLSFREFLNFKYGYNFKAIPFENILKNHNILANKILYQINGFFSKWEEYLKIGIYPFGINLNPNSFFIKLGNTLERIILEDLPSIKNFDTITLENLKKIFFYLSNIPPSEINISNLSKKIGINKVTFSNILQLLDKIGVIYLIPKYGNLSDSIRKSYKIFLSNSNKYYIRNENPNIGTLRESIFLFFLNSLNSIEIFYKQENNFIIKYKTKNINFEIGGKNKLNYTKKYSDSTLLILDEIEVANKKNIIPLRLFGFLR